MINFLSVVILFKSQLSISILCYIYIVTIVKLFLHPSAGFADPVPGQ